MDNRKYSELKERLSDVERDMKAFVIETVEKYGGRISLAKPEGDDDDDGNYYPVTSVLYGKNSNFNIKITDVHVDEHGYNEIYADGEDTNTGTDLKDFCIYSEQYSDILDFIGVATERIMSEKLVGNDDRIITFATFLGALDLVKEHNQLTEYFCSDGGDYLKKYECEFNVYYEKQLDQFKNLKDEKIAILSKNALLVKFASDLAEYDLVYKYKLLPCQLRDENGQYLGEYKEEANEHYNTFHAILIEISQSPLQNEIDKLWNKYVSENKIEPMFVLCQVQFLDGEKEMLEVKMKMLPSDEDDGNDGVFYYCEDLKDFKSLAGGGVLDFRVLKINSFSN